MTGPLGAWSGPALAYRDNGDGTATDLNTGLMWEVKVAGGGGPATCLTDLHAVGSHCSWHDATGPWIDALNAEGGTGYAGHADWRLPNIRELQSIVDYGERSPSIDPSFPGATASSVHWSATSNSEFPGNAWWVSFKEGTVSGFLDKPELYRVRAVRGGR